MPGPREIEEHLKSALRHQQAGRMAQAESLYRKILSVQSDHPDALHLLGVIMILRNRFDVAADLITKAIAVAPDAAMFHYNLGLALANMSKWAEAVEAYRRATELDPHNAVAAANLGDALKQLLRFREAEEAYRRALAIDPSQADVHNNLGVVLQAQEKLVDAEAAYHAAVRMNPQVVSAYNNLSRLRRRQNRFEEAIQFARRGLQLSPNLPELHYNLGSALLADQQSEAAIEELQLALRLRPDYLTAMNELGQAFKGTGRYMEAMNVYNGVIQLSPDYADAHVNKAILLLLLGDLPAGFREWEWRWRYPAFASQLAKQTTPIWDGSDLAGKTILLHAEQGLGDTIQFIRFAKLLKQRGLPRIILACQSSLVELLKRIPELDAVISRGDLPPPHDFHCPVMSLPLRLGTTLKTIPAGAPYIAPETSRDAMWRAILYGPHAFKIGLCWSSNADNPEGARKNIPLQALAPLFQLQRATFYSLQLGPASQQIAEANVPMQLQDHTSQIRDFSDTAALIFELDVVVTVDTAVAHLAGAMGKPTFTLLPFEADWRWHINRTDSPWYPSKRLFRQPTRGEWNTPIEQVVTALRALQERQ